MLETILPSLQSTIVYPTFRLEASETKFFKYSPVDLTPNSHAMQIQIDFFRPFAPSMGCCTPDPPPKLNPSTLPSAFPRMSRSIVHSVFVTCVLCWLLITYVKCYIHIRGVCVCLNKYIVIVDIFTYIIYLHDTFAYTHRIQCHLYLRSPAHLLWHSLWIFVGYIYIYICDYDHIIYSCIICVYIYILDIIP